MLLLLLTIFGGIFLAALSALLLTGVLFKPNDLAHVAKSESRGVPAGFHP